VECTQTIMRSAEDRRALARNVLALTIPASHSEEPHGPDKSALRAAADQP
jgi:hypothetical protein